MGLAVKPLRRERHMFRWCVKGSRGSVTAVFDSRRRTVLVATTAGGHGNRGVRPGTAIAQVKRAYGRPRRLGRGLFFRALGANYPLIGMSRGRVRFLVATPRLTRDPPRLRTFLRRGGL